MNSKQACIFFISGFALTFGACTKKSALKFKPNPDSSVFTDNKTDNTDLNNKVVIKPSPTPTATPVTPPVVVESAPMLRKIPDLLYPDKALLPGVKFVVDFNNISKGEPGNDLGMNYTCIITAFSDLSSYPCAQGDGVSFDGTTGVLQAVPSLKSVGTYKVKVIGTNSAGASTSEFVLTVRDPYSQSGLMLDLDARFANRLVPATASQTHWANLSNASDRDVNILGLPQWKGDGSKLNPLRQDFNLAGNLNRLVADTRFSSRSRLTFSMLGSLASPSSPGSVIVGTSTKNKSGWSFRQSVTKPGKVELVAGQSYQDLVLSLKPVGYWRLNEDAGTVAKDISGNNNNADIFATTGSYTLGTNGPLTNDSSTGIAMKNYSRIIAQPSATLNTQSTITISIWFKPDGVNGYQPLVEYGRNQAGAIGVHLWQYGDQQTAMVNFRDTNRGDHPIYANKNYFPILINQWNHVVAVYDGSYGYLYVNGKKAVSQYLGQFSLHTSENLQIGMREGGYYWYWQVHNPYQGEISEVSIFKKPLTQEEAFSLYDGGKGKYGSVCYSKSTMTSNVFTTLMGSIDPTNATSGLKLFVNGQEECSAGMNMPESQISSQYPLTMGAAADGELPASMSVSDFKLYSSDFGSVTPQSDLSLIHSLYRLRVQ